MVVGLFFHVVHACHSKLILGQENGEGGGWGVSLGFTSLVGYAKGNWMWTVAIFRCGI